MSKPCPKCGALISDSASLCQYCGCPIGGNSSDNSTTQPNFVSAPQTTKLKRKEHSPKRFFIALLFLITLGCFVYYCGQGNSASDKTSTNEQNELHTADLCTDVVENMDSDEDDTLDSDEKVTSEQAEQLPYSGKDVYEYVVEDFGKRTIRTQADESLCFTDLMKNKKNCFILLSKKDYYLYVYEPQNGDTVMLARFDCAFALKKGDKSKQGDMRTPHCVSMSKPFYVSEIKNASSWCHDFGDGRGSIKSYGEYFIRLRLAGHQVEHREAQHVRGFVHFPHLPVDLVDRRIITHADADRTFPLYTLRQQGAVRCRLHQGEPGGLHLRVNLPKQLHAFSSSSGAAGWRSAFTAGSSFAGTRPSGMGAL